MWEVVVVGGVFGVDTGQRRERKHLLTVYCQRGVLTRRGVEAMGH